MNVISLSIRQPVGTFALVILVVMFGLLGLDRLPFQLTPDVESPTISVRTTWAGATPYEIEKEIVEPQEEVLKSLASLVTMESSSYNNYGEVTLTFKVGTNLETTLSRVSNKLNEVSGYPTDADRPVISGSGAQSSPVIWMMLKTFDDNPREVGTYRTFFEEQLRGTLERVPGLGSLFVFGGSERRLEVIVDPQKLAQQQLTLSDVVSRLQTANVDTPAGVLGLGKRNYRVRTVSQFQQINDFDDVPIINDGLHSVYLHDVADVRLGFEPNPVPVTHNGDPMVVIGVRKEAGANVIALTGEVRNVVDSLNQGILKQNGVYIHWAYDQVPYIKDAIDTVQRNLLIGAVLAIVVLFVFLRSAASTLTVALAIPISVISTFIFLYAFDRTINVISLAGISFAVGMLVDNAIVVLENIDRHRQLGKSAFQASYDGAREVWGAVLASSLTTVAVFLPILFVEEEAGQLFRDIAIAITFSILVSLFVSVSVIPAITNKLYGFTKVKAARNENHQGNFFVRLLMWLSGITLKNALTRLLTIAFFVGISVYAVLLLLPKAEYLPQGNRNLILNILVPPPGYSDEKRREIGDYIYQEVERHVDNDGVDGVPQIENIFYVSSDSISLFGGTSTHRDRARELMPLFTRVMNSIPGMFGISLQSGVFAQSLGRDRSVDVNISGVDTEALVAAGRTLYGAVSQSLESAQIRPVPSLEISYPEVSIVPNRGKLISNGLTERDIGLFVNVLMDGAVIGEFKPEGKRVMDFVVRSDETEFNTPESLLSAQLSNRYGDLVRLADVVDLTYARGMTQINRLERKRNIRLEVTPPDNIALQEAIEIISALVADLDEQDQLKDVEVAVGGNADKLDQTRQALQWNFILAVVIIFLLMASLFGNFFYPLVIMVSIPMAAAGGFIGLSLVNVLITPQAFDILVMLGFIILVGTVVNNAILIVHQALNNLRYEGLSQREAIRLSVRTRIRPIFMSSATSLFGLLPLVIATGSGTELYRGLGAVLLGGLAVSTLLTLFVIPALLSFALAFEGRNQAADATAVSDV
ncbi:MAG: efflux RND transporter permease subunit [Pseudomonadota bacterium]